MTEYHVPVALDHVGWLVGDLEAARLAFARLGFSVTAPGTLKSGGGAEGAQDVGQRSAHFMFSETYVELTAVAPGARPAHLAPYMAEAGLTILALRVENADRAYELLQEAAVAVLPTAHSERPISYAPPAIQGIASFNWFMCAPEDFPDVLVCCVEHRSKSLIFQPAVSEHANGVLGLREVVMLESDLPGAQVRYQALAGALADGASDTGRLTLLDSAAAGKRFPGADLGSRPRSIGIGLRVANLDRVARCLDQSGTAYHEGTDRIWCLGPETTVLDFREN